MESTTEDTRRETPRADGSGLSPDRGTAQRGMTTRRGDGVAARTAWPDATRRGTSEERWGKGLGWFSIGLGLAEVAAPEKLAELIGAPETPPLLLRLFGLREIAQGIGILAQDRPTTGVWARVGGDMLDLAVVGSAFFQPEAKRGRLVATTGVLMAVGAVDALVAQMLSAPKSRSSESGALCVRKTIAIGRSPEEIWKFWRQLDNLPRFMAHLESVRETGDRRSHWVAKGPGGARVEWDAEITDEQPGRRLAWRALGGSDVYHSGSVTFEKAPGDRGTFVVVEIAYEPPAGALGAGVAKMMGQEPGQQVQADLRRLKQVLETGAVVHSDATLEGIGTFEQRPGQPPAGRLSPELSGPGTPRGDLSSQRDPGRGEMGTQH